MIIRKVNRNALLLDIFIHISFLHQCSSNSTDSVYNEDDTKEFLYRELSADTYFNLPFHDPGDSVQSFRRQYANRRYGEEREWLNDADFEWSQKYNPPAWKGPPGTAVDYDFYNTNQKTKSVQTLNPDSLTIFHLCYAISYMWRRGRKGIHRYFRLRDTYYDHMPFEIGYITQTIMAKYQNVLELYELATRMEPGHKIGRPHLYSMYKNILEDCRAIIHLCNMIHEVTRKYRMLQYSNRWASWMPVVYDPSQKFQDPAGNYYMDRPWWFIEPRPTRYPERGVEGLEHEKIVHEDPAIFKIIKEAGELGMREEERQYKVKKHQLDYFHDHGHFTMTSPVNRKPKRWRSNEPNIYGWEPSND